MGRYSHKINMSENLQVLWGKVKRGKDRGKGFGFPTANIPFRKPIDEGVYISQTRVEKTVYPSLTFIGAAKTFDEYDVWAETYIFSFSEDIYGQWITVTLLKKIRGNKKFRSVESLLAQMKRDEKRAQDYFRKRGKLV